MKQLAQSKPASQPELSLGKLDDIVRSYFADKLNLVRHAHTFGELEEVINGQAEIEPLREIYAVCESQIYRADEGGIPEPNVTELIKKAQQSIQTH